jgi:nucleotide-binding universal stress UspA family protein
MKPIFRSLFVPLDGTPEAERGVMVASWLARSVESDITLVHVLPAAPEPLASKSAFLYLARIAHQLPLSGARVGMQVRTGSIADGVLSGVELASADLLVIATSLRDVHQIVFRTRIPVVLVPKHTRSVTWFRRVLVPVSGSMGERVAFRVAAELAHRTGAQLVVLRVIASTRRHPKQRARKFEDACVAHSAPTRGDLSDAIVEASQQLDPDIVVLGIREFIERVALSSVDAAAVPLLLIPDTPASAPA